MPTLALSNFNIVVSVLGGWISLFGLVSYLCKERFYLSEALISLLAGAAFSPPAANLIRPLDYAGTQANVDAATLSFTRLVLGVQLVLAGVQLPSRYLQKQWRPLAVLLGPVMTAMWLATGLLVWGLVPGLPFLHALAVGACVTPTDPVLSSVIVKGRFADHNVPRDLQQIIVAESGANDGLGYPFLFLALYLIEHTGPGGGGAGLAMRLWFGETWGYTVLLSVAYGAAVGWLAKELLHWARGRGYVDRESFLVFAISLALFIVGTCGLIGSDDVLACFVAGNAFTWDDWFRLETLDDSLQPTIDMLLNVAVFLWLGAVCPWASFAGAGAPVPLRRLAPLGVLVLLLRRLPWVLAARRWIPQIEHARQAVFVGFFGPVGVSAVFYLYITLGYVDALRDPAGGARPDLERLPEVATVVVWFIAVCSIVVHGLSIPLGKLGYNLPRTLSRSTRSPGGGGGGPDQPAPPFHVGGRVGGLRLRVSRSGGGGGAADEGRAATPTLSRSASALPMYHVGGAVVPSREAYAVAAAPGAAPGAQTPRARPETPAGATATAAPAPGATVGEQGGGGVPPSGGAGPNEPRDEARALGPGGRTIRSPDGAGDGPP